MYQCHIAFYLVGGQCRAFEMIKEMPALEHFTHEFIESDTPQEALMAKADAIFMNIQDRSQEEILSIFSMRKNEDAEIVLLMDSQQTVSLSAHFAMIHDIWTMPMPDEEIRFRFMRWQNAYKIGKDYWQVSQYLEATINNIPNLVWYKDKNGIHEKVNDSFCRTVNKTKEQVEGQGHAYIWDVEQDDPACIESEQEVMTTKKTFVSEEVIQTGEGLRTLTTYKSPLYDCDGSVMGTVGVAIDITQERAYEEEIVRKNQSLETIFTTIDCGVIRHTIDGTRVLSINRAALEILGYENYDELVEEGFDWVAASVVDEDKGRLQERMKTLQKEGDSVSVEYRVKRKDGEILHVMGNVKLLREGGELVYQRFLLDCTAQKLQEKKKERHQKELIQALGVDYSLVFFFDLDTGMGMLLRNDDSVVSMPDIADNGMVLLDKGLSYYIDKYVYDDDKDMIRENFTLKTLRRELAGKNIYYTNYRTVKKGKMEYFQMKAVRTGKEGSGVVLGLRSVDEETRREMEQKTLLEDALLQANRASKAKSVFLSNMSHDIRTPMNAIVGFTNLAITHIDNKEQVEEYLKKIMTSGNHLLSLINDVLDMSHIESGKIHLEEKQCSLPEILNGIRNILQADINAKQLELQIDTVDVFDEDIYCDKLRLNQVLLNLLSNSVKYTGPGGTVSLRITEMSGAPAGYARYEFDIKDTGYGMSKEFVEHIFEPFEREQTSTNSGIQGTGLGMAITKNIVDMMNGTISVKSELGVGSEFTVAFTFRLHAEAKEQQVIPELAGCKVLVVDDDFNSCDSVSYMLGQLGLHAEWTLSGKEAVLRARQASTRGDGYDAYIIDWLLPDMNGVEVTRRIQKEVGGEAPVIILSAYDWADIEEEARDAGVVAFCNKPLFLSELRRCLQSIIKPDKEENKSIGEKEKVRSGRILLAEDVELNQEIAIAILGDAGFTTEVAGNGRIAVEMLKNSEPGYYKLILMDVQMPVMNGYEATNEIRSLENKELASIPIIAMTANAFEEDKQEALKCGMNSHIAKPIDIQKLLDTLDAILS